MRKRHCKQQNKVAKTLLLLGILLVAKNLARTVDASVSTAKESSIDASILVDNNEQLSDTNEHVDNDSSGSNECDFNDVIIVVTVDGTTAALSAINGSLLWKRDGEISEKQQQHHTSDGSNMHWRNEQSSNLFRPLVWTSTTKSTSFSSNAAAVPSIDGRVYLTMPSSNNNIDTETVVTNVADMVNRAPFVDQRGRLYTANRYSTAVALDALTGEILRVVPAAVVNEDKDCRVVWIGRTDSEITVHNPRSGHVDAKFVSATILSVSDMMQGSQQQQQQQVYGNNNDNVFLLSSGDVYDDTGILMSQLVATPNGRVAYRNYNTGVLDWVASHRFRSPVAYAIEAKSGNSIGIDIVPDIMNDGACTENELLQRLQTQLSRTVAVDESERTIVTSLDNGDMYAMTFTLPRDQMRRIGQGTVHTHAGNSASSSSHKKALPGELHSNSNNNYGGNKDLHSKVKIRPTCLPGNAGYPNCLAFPSSRYLNGYAVGSDGYISESAPFLNENAIAPLLHPEYGYVPHQNSFKIYTNTEKRRFRKILKILGSWIAPLIVVIFFTSFEMGRRKRDRDQGKLGGLNQQSNANGMTTEADLKDKGVIQVQEDVVLGYGGHGTVVYKGTLEGRNVAVKRMLKTYHASADREISLLIESDGHPNVVRYFLKEVRGDFVYLALELCELSLHELIVCLRNNMDQNGLQRLFRAGVHSSIKLLLSQITAGVKHLHSLRIVHRDLKPANILLACTSTSKAAEVERSIAATLNKFDNGDLTAKISDMGLGKQLQGQSSFGGSTLGNNSLYGQSNGGQSSVAGVGAGSVGWQAPEVMAQRLSSDISVHTEESGSLCEASCDASPLDAGSSATRTSRSVDIFSLGCIFYSTLIPASHPFGEWYERESNIMHNRPNIEVLRRYSFDAYDLVDNMIKRNPKQRPTAKEVHEHPFFWQYERRISFLCDFSDRLEVDAVEYEKSMSPLSVAIECKAGDIFGTTWDRTLDTSLVRNVQKFRTYDATSVRDLLRLIRNKHHHFDELPVDFRESIGGNTAGLLTYFESAFPSLLVRCFRACINTLPQNDWLVTKYNICTVSRAMLSPIIDEKSVNETPIDHELIVEDCSTLVEVDESCKCDDGLISTADADNSSKIAETSSQVLDKVDNFDKSYTAVESCPTIVEDIVSDKDTVGNGINDCTLTSVQEFASPQTSATSDSSQAALSDYENIVFWECSAVTKSFNARGWYRSSDEWCQQGEIESKKIPSVLMKFTADPKFRTRLCNNWDESNGTFCTMRKRNKCIFAHGPVELRVKQGKHDRWGKLVDENGDNTNVNHSGGEDTYGAARLIESERRHEGKWSTTDNKQPSTKRKNTANGYKKRETAKT